MDFTTAVKTCFSKYATFEGRARRAELWYFALFQFLVSFAASLVDAVTGLQILNMLVTLALLLPNIAVAVRRLHDTDRSGWWYLLLFIPLVGIIVLLIWFCTKGSDGPNRFGGDPLAGYSEPAPATVS